MVFIIELIVLLNLCLSLLFPHAILANSIPDRSRSYLNVSSSVPADGTTTAIITVTLLDSAGNPVVGNTVSLEDSTNSGATITSISGTTDASGHALFSIRSTKNQTDILNVTDLTANIKLYNLGEVTFTSAGCYDSAPGSAPILVSALPINTNQIVLNWAPAMNPVSRYLISYGTSPGQYEYGNPNVGGQGTTSYTVGFLTPGKRYYFVVQAINGCTPGKFSNELSAVVGEAAITVTPPFTRESTLDTEEKIEMQNNNLPTSALRDTPLPSQNPVPTDIPDAMDDRKNDLMSRILFFASLGIFVAGSIGNFVYWEHEKKVTHLIQEDENKLSELE